MIVSSITSPPQGIPIECLREVSESLVPVAESADGADDCGAEAGTVSAAIENVDDVGTVTGVGGPSGLPSPVHLLISMFTPRHSSSLPVRPEIRHLTIAPLSMSLARSLAIYALM